MNQGHFRSFLQLGGLAVLLLGSALAHAAQLPSVEAGLGSIPAGLALQVEAIDTDKALSEDVIASKDQPLRYALTRPVQVSANIGGKASGGRWERLDAERVIWRLPISAPGAISIDLGFSSMYLPHGAELYLASADGSMVLGPYTEQDNTVSGEFWTPVVSGAAAELQLVVPRERQASVKLNLSTVHSGYRDIWTGHPANGKSGSCNVDIACPAADPYRDQVRAVARYSANGSLCTGELINNTRNDARRLFITANHCLSTQSAANTVVVYWRYENPTCRTPRGGASGVPLPVSGNAVVQTGGASLLAAASASDTTLLELRTAIPAAATAYWYGWDRSENTPTMGVSIHHANGDEKRIAIDNNPLQLSDAPAADVPGTFHWHVLDYELGTTEPGSSGSGLMNQNKHLIGVLSGGDAACFSGAPGTHDVDNDGDNDLDDYYGRLSKAWEGGGTPGTRVRDYLDPDASGANTLDGRDTCAAPNVALSGPANGTAGTPMVFSVAASGGAGAPFKVEWDIDNDGVTDRSTTGVTASTSINPSYPTAYSTTVVVRVSDVSGCTASQQMAINVAAPDIVATASAPLQVCGNGDSKIDPGERWRVPVDLFNAGGANLTGGRAIFAPTPAAALVSTPIGPDGFGYRAGDDSNGCRFSYIDLVGSVDALPIAPANTGTSQFDEGRAGPIALQAFSFYGTTVNSLFMSTNGYLTSASGDNGGDFSNQCGLDSAVGPRLLALHDDLVISGMTGGMRHKLFSSCPRAAESSGAATACEVFQWSGMSQFADGSGAVGNGDFEAIVYPATGQIVYQYRVPPNDGGASATVGIQANAGSAGLEYSCNRSNSVRTSQAVCIFNPAQPVLTPVRAELSIAGPPTVDSLASGQHQSVQAEFLVSPSATCGQSIDLRYVGTVDAKSYSMRAHSIASSVVGGGQSCQAVSNCNFPNDIVAPPDLQDGLYANPNRYGNGIGSFVIKPPVSATPIYFGLWFTGEANRNPTWYAIQGPMNTTVFPIAGPQPQATGVLYRAELTSSAPFQATLTAVGEALITYLSPTQYVFTWNLDGATGGEIQSILYPGGRSRPNRTGAWYFPSESGWGQVIDDHLFGGNPEQVIMEFIYDAAGKARWTLGASADINQGAMSQTTYRVHCPNCANFPDFFSLPLAAGTISRSFTDTTHGTLSTAIVYPAPLSGAWTRSPAVSIVPLTSPGPQ